MAAPYLPVGLRVVAAVLALARAASAVWPVRVNRPAASGPLERAVWADPGAVTAWVVRLFSVYWTAVWGWAAILGRWPPYFPT